MLGRKEVSEGGNRMITLDESTRLDRLRQKTMLGIERALEIDPYCKSSEGTFEVLFSWPDYFSDVSGTRPPDFVRIRLYCYVLGPHRHYEWSGPTFTDALRKAEAEIDSWIEHLEDEE